MDDAAEQRPRILVVGDSFVDVHAGPISSLPTWGTNTVSEEAIVALPGGAALNVASNLQRLGGRPMLFSGIGRDSFGDLLRGHCHSLGLRVWEAAADAAVPVESLPLLFQIFDPLQGAAATDAALGGWLLTLLRPTRAAPGNLD